MEIKIYFSKLFFYFRIFRLCYVVYGWTLIVTNGQFYVTNWNGEMIKAPTQISMHVSVTTIRGVGMAVQWGGKYSLFLIRKRSGNISETEKKNRIFDTYFHIYECLSCKRDKVVLFFVVSQIQIRTSWLMFFFLIN